MSAGPAAEDTARRRFVAIQAVRWAGVALAIAGIVALYGPGMLPRPLGYLLAPVGIVTALIVPTLLARRWRSPPSDRQ